MSSNAVGTIIIAGILLVTLILGWFLLSISIYFLITLVFHLKFDFIISVYLFLSVMCIRAFYPKNVFV